MHACINNIMTIVIIIVLFLSTKHDTSASSTFIGRKIEMRFKVDKKIKWFSGEVSSFDEHSGKYGIYFPCDGETVFVYPDDKDIRYVD